MRSTNKQDRHLGLRALARARALSGEPVLGRQLTHRLFLRELRDWRDHMDPALALAGHDSAPVRLLADSYRESADMALERGVQALACWYEPGPLVGVLDRLRSSDRDLASPALEYLEHILPRAVFTPVRRLFEPPAVDATVEPTAPDPLAAPATAAPDLLAARITAAWGSDDVWLRACAVRASSAVPSFDRGVFSQSEEIDPGVRAELEALAAVAC